jgi:hypothetical protein
MRRTYRGHLGLEAFIGMSDIVEIDMDRKEDETCSSNSR